MNSGALGGSLAPSGIVQIFKFPRQNQWPEEDIVPYMEREPSVTAQDRVIGPPPLFMGFRIKSSGGWGGSVAAPGWRVLLSAQEALAVASPSHGNEKIHRAEAAWRASSQAFLQRFHSRKEGWVSALPTLCHFPYGAILSAARPP